MKTLCRLFSLLFLLSVSGGIKSQLYPTGEKKVTIQIRGGMNISNLSAWDNHYDNYDNATAKVGFNIGGIVDISLGKGLYLQPGLILTSKGAKIDRIDWDNDGYMDAEMNAVYLQVPFYLGYKFAFSNGYNLGVSAGPYFAYGIAGKTTLTQRGNRYELSENTFQNNGLWNRPDIGLGMETQFELKRVVFILGIDAGLAKAWNRQMLTHNMDVRNNNVYLSVGFKL